MQDQPAPRTLPVTAQRFRPLVESRHPLITRPGEHPGERVNVNVIHHEFATHYEVPTRNVVRPSMQLRQGQNLLTREQNVTQEQGALPFVLTVRRLIDTEQLMAARRMLDAAPSYVLSNQAVMKLRSLLAPPVIRRLERRDTDRSAEFEWLKREGRHHRGRWVAVQGGALLAEAPTLQELREALKRIAPTQMPLLYRVE